MPKVAAAFAAFLIALLPLSGGAEEDRRPSGVRVLATNAEGGVFPSERRFWFAVPEGERLRLVLDGVQTYLGAGPASAQLAAKEGEERLYELVAERLSANPEDVLLETRGYQVVVDAAPPASPVLRGRNDEKSVWTIAVEADPAVRVEAVVDEDGVVSQRGNLGEGFRSSARSLNVVAWTVDSAGNCSDPVAYAFEPFSLLIANPSEGTWANRQVLSLDAEGAHELFWTDDGSDPLGPAGRSWNGPVLVDKAGAVRLRAAARTPDGRVASAEVSYSVEEDGAKAETGISPLLEKAQLTPFRSEMKLPVPASQRWDITADGVFTASSELRFQGGGDVVLRPVAFVSRTVALLLGDGTRLRRYAYLLEPLSAVSSPSLSKQGTKAVESAVAAAAAGTDPVEIQMRPALYGAGASQVLAWPRRALRFRYRAPGDGLWRDASAPVPVGTAGGTFEWIADRGGSFSGPYSISLDSVPAAPADGALNFTAAPGSANRERVLVRSSPAAERTAFPITFSPHGKKDHGPRGRGYSALLEGGAELVLDVCDGEELEWNISGTPFLIDRRPPDTPRLSAPPSGSWLAEPPLLSLEGEGIVTASIKSLRSDGSTEEITFDNAVLLPPSAEGPVRYAVSAFATDAAGNRSGTISRDFVVDSSTLHVLGSATSGGRDGSRGHPFATLDEAFAASRSSSVRRILVSGTTVLNAAVELPRSIELRGGYSGDWMKVDSTSTVVVKAGSSIHARGSEIKAYGLELSGEPAEGPLLLLSEGARVELSDSTLSGASLLVSLENSRLELRDCYLKPAPRPSRASVAIRSREGTLLAVRVRMENELSPFSATMIEAKGGKIELDRVVLVAIAKDSATGASLRDADFVAREVDARAEASTYASALDSSGGRAEWKGGSLAAKARDVALLSLDATPAVLGNLRARVDASGVCRAVQARGAFPSIETSSFTATGLARGSEAFAGARPRAASIASNTFTGFEYLWERDFRAADQAAFDAAFAPPRRPNAVIRDGAGR